MRLCAGRIRGRTGFSPKQLEGELNLARCGGRTGNPASRWRNARRVKDDRVGKVEILAVKKVEYLRPKLKEQSLANPSVFQHGEIPCGQARSNQRVSSDVSIEPAVCRRVRRRQKRIGVEPLVRLAKDHRPDESRIRKRTHRISSISVV